jgi:membrane-associated phospholipid phosphatase
MATASLTVLCAWALAALMSLRWETSGLALVTGLILPWFVLSFAMRRHPSLAALAECCSLFATLVVTILSGGLIAVMSTRSPVPLGDATLIRADWALGLSARDFVMTVAAGPEWVIEGLRRAYVATTVLTLATLLVLPLIGQKRAAINFMLLFQLTVLTASVAAFLLPAYGVYTTIDPETVSRLPRHAGRYFWTALSAIRTAPDPVLSINSINAVVSFPSFHTVMALLFAQAWHKVRVVNVAMVGLSGVIIVSTVPMGGHYFIDVIAGLILWWGWSRVLEAALARNAAPFAIGEWMVEKLRMAVRNSRPSPA